MGDARGLGFPTRTYEWLDDAVVPITSTTIMTSTSLSTSYGRVAAEFLGESLSFVEYNHVCSYCGNTARSKYGSCEGCGYNEL